MSPGRSPRGCLPCAHCSILWYNSSPSSNSSPSCVGQGTHKATDESLPLLQPYLRTSQPRDCLWVAPSLPALVICMLLGSGWREICLLLILCHMLPPQHCSGSVGPTVSQTWGWSQTHMPAGAEQGTEMHEEWRALAPEEQPLPT